MLYRNLNSTQHPNFTDMTAYEKRVVELEKEGLTRSDAQAVADMEFESADENGRAYVSFK